MDDVLVSWYDVQGSTERSLDLVGNTKTNVYIKENKINPLEVAEEDSSLEIEVDVSNEGDELNLPIIPGYDWASFKVREGITHF